MKTPESIQQTVKPLSLLELSVIYTIAERNITELGSIRYTPLFTEEDWLLYEQWKELSKVVKAELDIRIIKMFL